MISEYSKLLDTVYELEGLLHLAGAKEEVPPRLHQLILEKGVEIKTLMEELGGEVLDTDTDPVAVEKDFFETPEEEPRNTSDEEGNRQWEEDIMAEKHVSEPDIYVMEEGEENETDENVDVSLSAEQHDDGPDEGDTIVAQPYRRSMEPDIQSVQRLDRKAPRFSLNDRFLFIRSLFGGKVSAFNNAMEKITTFDSYDEAEDYFIEEYGFNPEDDDTARFLSLIEEYFR